MPPCADTPQAPEPTPLNLTPQPIPFPPGQASVGSGPRRPTLQRGLCSLEQGGRPPGCSHPCRGPGSCEDGSRPTRSRDLVLISTPASGTPSQTASGRNKPGLLTPHAPAASPLSAGWGHIRVLRGPAGTLLLSQSRSENIRLPPGGRPPGSRGSRDRRRGTDNPTLSHSPSVEPVDQGGARTLCKGHGQDYGVGAQARDGTPLLQAATTRMLKPWDPGAGQILGLGLVDRQ